MSLLCSRAYTVRRTGRASAGLAWLMGATPASDDRNSMREQPGSVCVQTRVFAWVGAAGVPVAAWHLGRCVAVSTGPRRGCVASAARWRVISSHGAASGHANASMPMSSCGLETRPANGRAEARLQQVRVMLLAPFRNAASPRLAYTWRQASTVQQSVLRTELQNQMAPGTPGHPPESQLRLMQRCCSCHV